MAEMRYSDLFDKLKAYILDLIGVAGGGPGPYAPTPHDLASAHHTGTLGDSQATQFLKTDGSRQLTGNQSVADLVTIDGVDLSVLKGAYDIHAAATAAAGHAGIGAHNHQTTGAGGLLDHGMALAGSLLDDDHTQYASADGSGTRLAYQAARLNKSVVAGNGLTGGGTLTADVSLHVGAGVGITVGADTVGLDLTASLTWTGDHTFQGLTKTRHLLPELTDTYDLGSSTVLWRKGWLSELDTILFAQNTVTLLGGWLLISKDEGALPGDILAGWSQIPFGKAMTPGDFVLFRAALKMEYVLVGTLAYDTTYNVTRNLDGSGANGWPGGTPFAVLGTEGNGRIELNAYDTPRIQLLRQGGTYNAQTEIIRIGDLDGNWGFSGEKWGVALGEYVSGKTNLVLGDGGVLRIRDYTVDRVTLSAGLLTINDSTGAAVFTFNAASGAEFTKPLTLGSAGGIYQGTGTFATPTTGLKIWNDTGIGRLATYNGGVAQVYFDTSGKLNAGAGNVLLDAAGMTLLSQDYWYSAPGARIAFLQAGALTASIHNYYQVGSKYLILGERASATGIAGWYTGVSMELQDEAGTATSAYARVHRKYLGVLGYDDYIDLVVESGTYGANALHHDKLKTTVTKDFYVGKNLRITDQTAAPTYELGAATLFSRQYSLFAWQSNGFKANLNGAAYGGFLTPLMAWDLRALWTFGNARRNGAGGYVVDISTNARDLTQSNTEWGGFKDPPGLLYYLGFNGTTSYLYRATDASLEGNNFVFGAWINFDTAGRSHGIFRMGSTTTSINLLYYWTGSTGYFELGYWEAGGTYRSHTMNYTITPGAWVYVSLFFQYTASGNNYWSIRANDSVQGWSNDAWAAPRAAAGDFEIGRAGPTGGYYLDGKIAIAMLAGNLGASVDEFFHSTRGYFL